MYKVPPPFENNLQAFLFLVILFCLVAAPFVPSKILKLQPANKYLSVPLKYSNYHYVGEQIQLGGDVDVLFIGSSDAWTAFDAPFLSETLSSKLNRPVRILNFGTNWFGAESYYIRLKDSLETLNPKIVIMPGSDAGFTYPHELTHYVWSEPQDISPSDIGLQQRLALYGSAVLGSMHQSYSKLSSVWKHDPLPAYEASLENMVNSQGFMGETHGWLSHWDPDRNNRAEFQDTTHPAIKLSIDDLTYSEIGDEKFKELHYTYNQYQTFFIKKMAEISAENGATFVSVSMPTHFKQEPHTLPIYRHLHENEEKKWLHIGVSMLDLFHGLSFEEMTPFYSNESHLNASGAKVFSRSLLPLLEKELSNAR